MSNGPCATLMIRMTPKISASPSATIAYSTPDRIPEMMTCPTIAGVMTRFTGGERAGGGLGGPLRERSALCPGRRGEEDLALREIVRPHDDLLFLLPLERDHLVGELIAVGIDLVVAKHRARLELQELLAHLVGVDAARPLDAFRVDHAARVAGRGVVGRLVLEFRLVGLEPLLVAWIIEHGLPLGGAVDVLGAALEGVVELRQVAAHRDAIHLRVDVELLHLPGEGHRIV